MDVYKTFGLSEYDRERESGRVVGGKVCEWDDGCNWEGGEWVVCGILSKGGAAGFGDFGAGEGKVCGRYGAAGCVK